MPEKKINGGSCAVERISGAGCYQSSIALSQSLLARSTMGRPAFRLATNLGLFPIWEDGVKRGIVADRLKGFTFRFPFVYQALHFIQEHLLIRFAPRLRVGVRRPRFVMNQATDVEVEFRQREKGALPVWLIRVQSETRQQLLNLLLLLGAECPEHGGIQSQVIDIQSACIREKLRLIVGFEYGQLATKGVDYVLWRGQQLAARSPRFLLSHDTVRTCYIRRSTRFEMAMLQQPCARVILE
jgi:hypothetical protein